MADQLARQGTDAGFQELAKVPGYVVSREERAGDDETTLWLEFAPGTTADRNEVPARGRPMAAPAGEGAGQQSPQHVMPSRLIAAEDW